MVLRNSLQEEATMTFALMSSDFADGQKIPRALTCEGSDLSPALSWTGVPAGTKSLALVVDDPDAPDPKAPKMVWVHWILYNLPPSTTRLEQGVQRLPDGTREGLNDWKRTGYGGPCPPIGRHRYFHTLYALDAVLPDLKHPTKAALETALKPHVLGKAVLMGTYQKGD
jgi:Raf kinase inhibitor-like YbhB/YbcL family protein